jgi:hypothetical protein
MWGLLDEITDDDLWQLHQEFKVSLISQIDSQANGQGVCQTLL